MLDGGLASELTFRGADLKDELWSAKLLMEDPQSIFDLHYDYYKAGADIAITASYQATFEGLAKRGLNPAQAKTIFAQSIQLAQTARDLFWKAETPRIDRTYPLVAASIGPYGAFLADGSEYTGQYGLTEQALIDFHQPRMEALIAASPDILAMETIPCLTEAQALLRLLESFPSQQGYLCFSCQDGTSLSSGEPFREAVALAASSPQIIGVGINCTAPHFISPLLGSVDQAVAIPYVVYPNRGEHWDAQGKCWVSGSDSSQIVDLVAAWYHLGVRVFGGCCRIRPSDISAMRTRLSETVVRKMG